MSVIAQSVGTYRSDLQPIQNHLNIADFGPGIDDRKAQNWLAIVG
jgi:hypothetical protein